MLEAINVTVNFGGLLALDNLNLKVQEGERRGIIGPNGSGKTTLINVITGYVKPTSGKVLFKGEDITRYPPHKIVERGIGRTFQITNIYPNLTIYENIWLAAQARNKLRFHPLIPRNNLRDVEETVESVLKMIGLSQKSDMIAKNCSYGDQRLIEIGIVLALDPSLILLDEPTAALSMNERERIVKVIKEISKTKTLIVVEHSMDVIKELCDITTVLFYGKVLIEAPTKEVLENEEVRKVYLGLK
jgi:branched-chain amino acid transport system ATP-binding protein